MLTCNKSKVRPMTTVLSRQILPPCVLDRRSFVVAGVGTIGLAVAAPALAVAQEKPPTPNVWELTVNTITGGATVADGRMTFDVPEIAENGNVIPFTVIVDSPMTEQDHVKTIHLVATGNPIPLIATFRFRLEAGRAAVTSRMRLAKTQDVITIAELSNGTFVGARKTIKVTIGGCGG